MCCDAFPKFYTVQFAFMSGLVLLEMKFLQCLVEVLYQVQSSFIIDIDMPVRLQLLKLLICILLLMFAWSKISMHCLTLCVCFKS